MKSVVESEGIIVSIEMPDNEGYMEALFPILIQACRGMGFDDETIEKYFEGKNDT